MGMWQKRHNNAIDIKVGVGMLRQEGSFEREVALILSTMPYKFALPGE